VISGPVAPDPSELQILHEMIPFAVSLGIELLEATSDVVRARLDWEPQRCTAAGVMHGGAIMALADNCGVCAFLNLPAGAHGTATIESNANFLRAVTADGITANTRPLHRGRTLIVLDRGGAG
jgi:uncharacterized protein (TIGR00369 family)